MTSSPVIVTERLEFRLPTKADIVPMTTIVAHPETGRYLGRGSEFADHFTRFQRNCGSWFLHGYGSFILRRRGQAEVIGNAGVFHSYRGLGPDFDDSPEAGWILAHDQVGQGLGREAMDAALAWFKCEHGAQRIVCMTAPENAASIRLAGKLGFTHMRDAALSDGEAVSLFERLA